MTNYTGPDPARIRTMFAAIARRYDRANTVLSGGVHHLWRRKAVRHADIKPGQRVLITDDLLATGGTIEATINLVEKLGGIVAGCAFLIELTYLDGRDKLEGYEVCTLLQY